MGCARRRNKASDESGQAGCLKIISVAEAEITREDVELDILLAGCQAGVVKLAGQSDRDLWVVFRVEDKDGTGHTR